MIEIFKKNLFIAIILLIFPSNLIAQDSQQDSQDSFLSRVSDKISDTISGTMKNPNNISNDAVKDTLEDLLLPEKNNDLSLMFDDEESAQINRAIESQRGHREFNPTEITRGRGLTPEEELARLEATRKAEEEKRKAENEKSYAHLSSIIYLNKNDWVVWINQKKITAKDNNENEDIFLKLVKKDLIKVKWKMSVSKWKILSGNELEDEAPAINKNNQVEIEFFLKPNQSYSLVENKVIEGRKSIIESPTSNISSSL